MNLSECSPWADSCLLSFTVGKVKLDEAQPTTAAMSKLITSPNLQPNVMTGGRL